MRKEKHYSKIGEVKFDDDKKKFIGYIHGQKVEMKEYKGTWYVEETRYVTIFDVEPKDRD